MSTLKTSILLFSMLALLASACSFSPPSPPPKPPPMRAEQTSAPPPPVQAEQTSAPPPASPTQTQPPAGDAPVESGTTPTLATCRAWIQEQHTLNYPNHGCAEHADILNSVEGAGGGVIPLDDSKFFIAWFPDQWEQLDSRTLIVTLHGSGGCTERVYQWWARPAAERNYALVALQYAQEDATAAEGYTFDDSDQIYENLRTVFGELQAHCPLDDTTVVYHGFSRGSARSFRIAMLDRADEGMKRFSAFIADSGTEFADTGGQVPAYLQEASADAYSGARFWLYCGGEDHDGKTCEGMKRMGPLLEEHGATVTTYRYAPGRHGIFSTVRPGSPPSPALTALYEYIDSLSSQPPERATIATPTTESAPAESGSAPTLASCRAWVRENHSLDYPTHGCTDYTNILQSVEKMGGGVIPLSESYFYITWFPDGWEQMSDRRLIVTLHGNGGCAENNFKWWREVAAEHGYAVVALQYAQQPGSPEDLDFMDAGEIYDSLRTIMGDLQAYCPLEGVPVVYHGFSRGSALSFQIALMDNGPDGMKAFTTFISDSGGGFADTGGAMPGYLENAPENAYQGVHFWLYCGERDHEGRTCEDMDRMMFVIPSLSGTVDELYKYPQGGHGIFIPGEVSPAITAMLDYIDSLAR